MNIIERIKGLKKLSTEVEFDFPSEAPQIRFTVERISEMERRGALSDATVNFEFKPYKYSESLFKKLVGKHLLKCHDIMTDTDIAVDTELKTGLVETLKTDQVADFVNAYEASLDEDLKKAEKKTTSGKATSKA